MKKQAILMILMLFFISIHGQEKMETFTKGDFSMSYPESWMADGTGRMGSQVIFFSNKMIQGRFQVNINVLLQDLTGQNIDLKKFIEISVQQVKDNAKEYTIEKNQIIKNGTKEYGVLVWSGLVSGTKLKFKQVVHSKGEQFYILTLTTIPEVYDEYIATADKMMQSFKLKD